jgi:hypothetical protein
METEDSPAARVRARLNELGVGPKPIDPDLDQATDYSPDVIGARDLAYEEVQIVDRAGKSWSGNATVALKALEGAEATGDPADVWERLRVAQ